MFNTAHLIETALLVLAAYLAGCVVGYGTRLALHAGRGIRQVTSVAVSAPEIGRRPSSAARLAARVDEPLPSARIAPEHSSPGTGKPPAFSRPNAGMPDDLKQIKGIGPKIEASLNALGIYHFNQIAQWTQANVDWVDSQLAFKGCIRRERWVEQAAEMLKTDA